jgi:hypothetical protein
LALPESVSDKPETNRLLLIMTEMEKQMLPSTEMAPGTFKEANLDLQALLLEIAMIFRFRLITTVMVNQMSLFFDHQTERGISIEVN